MKTKQIFLCAMLLFVAGVFFTSCKKSESVEIPRDKQRLTLYLTDDPGFFDQVFVDIRAVQVLVDTTRDTRRNDTCNWEKRLQQLAIGSNRQDRTLSRYIWRKCWLRCHL